MAQFMSHIGGLSEDRAVVADYQFQYGNNVDHRSNPRGIVLSRGLVDTNYPWNSSYTINGVISNGDSGSLVFFNSGWEVNFYNGTFGWNIATYTTSTNKDIRGAWIFTISGTAYILYVAQEKIHRSTVTGGSFIEDAYSFTPTSTGSARPVFIWNRVDANRMYFGAGYKLMYVDNAWGIGTALTFNPSEQIIGISWNNDLLRIYLTDGVKSYVKLWWGVEDTADYTNPLGNIILYSATSNASGNDYIVSDRGVFECNGYNSSPILFQSTQNDNTRLFSNYVNGTLFDGKYFYFGGSEKWENSIFVWGKTRVNSKDTLSQVDIGTTYAERTLRWVQSFGSLTLVATTNKVYSFTPINTTSELPIEGEIIEPTIYGTHLSVLKTITSLRVGYDLSNGYGWGIDVYLRKEINGTWVKLWEITDTTKNEVRFDPPAFAKINMSNFYQIELKFVLKSSTDRTKTPLYQSAIFTFTEDVE